METQNRIFKNCGTITEGITYIQWEYQKKKERKEQKKYLSDNYWEISKINDKHQTTVPESSENTKQDKFWKIYTCIYIVFKVQKVKVKRDLERSWEKKKAPYL